MTDEKIIQVAESFKLPVGTQRIYENEVEDYNYIIVRKGTLKRNNCCSYTRTIISLSNSNIIRFHLDKS